MNQFIKQSCILSLTFFSTCMFTQDSSQNAFFPRPFTTDMAREIILQSDAWTGNADGDNGYGTAQITMQYYRNIHENKATGIGSLPFWSNSNNMTIGNNINGVDNERANVSAWQFGLGSVSEQGTITLAPIVKNIGFNIFLYFGSEETKPGFFTKINTGVGSLSIDPRLSETLPRFAQPNIYPANAFQASGSAGGAGVNPPYKSMTQAFAGGNIDSGTIFTGLQYGKIDGKRRVTQFGDIDFCFGYNIIADDTMHAGIGLRISAPTTNKQTGRYIFEPIYGKGGHWGLGIEGIAHYTLWEGHDDNNLQVWFDMYALHLFNTESKRSFDLTLNGAGSKYLLITDFQNGQIQNSIQPLVNISTLNVNSKFGILIDLALIAKYNTGNWTLSGGYNLMGRSKETISIKDSIYQNRYAILGAQYNAQADGTPNYTCEPSAKMTGMMTANTNGVFTDSVKDVRNAANRISDVSEFDVTAAQQLASISSKFFGNIDYRWISMDYCPTVGLFGAIEVSNSDNTALSQWSLGFHGGISF
ncbi:hypothetical protein EBR77_00945 [bacterium]|nr:hypothetical protein [bacterium]